MRVRMKNNYKNINNWHTNCNQPTNQPTNLSYTAKAVIFPCDKTEYYKRSRLLLSGTKPSRRSLF